MMGRENEICITKFYINNNNPEAAVWMCVLRTHLELFPFDHRRRRRRLCIIHIHIEKKKRICLFHIRLTYN